MSDTITQTDTTNSEAPVATADGEKTFSLEYVQELRRENAAQRTSKAEAVEAAVAAVTAEYEAKLADKDTAHTELQNQFEAAQLELEKYRVAISSKVPSDKVQAFVDILKGNTAEEISESAKAAYELAGGFSTSKSPAFDPSQGIGGKKDPIPLNGDPILQAVIEAVKNK